VTYETSSPRGIPAPQPLKSAAGSGPRGSFLRRWSQAFLDVCHSHRAKRLAEMTLRQARRLVIAVIGGTVLLLGLVMVVTPGPAIIVIPTGLAILAVEFAWARRLLRRFKDTGDAARARLRTWWRGDRP
jgi:uncharacterized protein (TIGR02611 family)